MPDEVDNLRRQLGEFLAHEMTPVDRILGQHTMEHVFQEIETILRSTELEAIGHVLGFVRDASGYEHPFREAFREHLAHSPLWGTLRDLLRAPLVHVRKDAIYTIGKLCCKEQAYLLSDAFPFYFDRDPINLPGLLSELEWLTHVWRWDFIEQIAAAEHYLFRWGLCEVFGQWSSEPREADRWLATMGRLKCDPNLLVAAEATWLVERIMVKRRPKLPKPQWRQEVKRIKAMEPKLTFGMTTIQFMNARWLGDYTLDEFDRFVSGLA